MDQEPNNIVIYPISKDEFEKIAFGGRRFIIVHEDDEAVEEFEPGCLVMMSEFDEEEDDYTEREIMSRVTRIEKVKQLKKPYYIVSLQGLSILE